MGLCTGLKQVSFAPSKIFHFSLIWQLYSTLDFFCQYAGSCLPHMPSWSTDARKTLFFSLTLSYSLFFPCMFSVKQWSGFQATELKGSPCWLNKKFFHSRRIKGKGWEEVGHVQGRTDAGTPIPQRLTLSFPAEWGSMWSSVCHLFDVLFISCLLSDLKVKQPAKQTRKKKKSFQNCKRGPAV